MARKAPPEIVGLAIKDFDEDKKAHDRFVSQLERRYRSYRGVMERRSEAAQWTNKLATKFVEPIIETMVAGLLDPTPSVRLRASRTMAPMQDMARLREGAKGLEILLQAQRKKSWDLTAQRTHRLQGLIGGLTATKQFWRFEEKERPYWESYEEPVHDYLGQQIGSIPRQRRATRSYVCHDDPWCEVVDMRDLIWHQAATSLDRAKRVFHRTWMTFEELKVLEANGFYENVDELKESRDFSDDFANREQDLFEADRTKDMIEVIEAWRRDDDGIRRTIIGNRRVLLKDGRNPFDHGRFPFVICSGMPDLFRIPGISEVELVQELQEMLWTLQNQQLDSLQLLNNAIILIADDAEDPEAFEFAPGERWLVPRPVQDTVQMWAPDVRAAEIAIPTIERLKSDMLATTGGAPWLSGDNRNADTNTATEASILTNLAQRRIAAKRQFFLEADSEACNQFIELNDQFLTESRYVQVVGPDGQAGWELVDPQSFREFEFRVEATAMEESLMRSERRAEAQAKLLVAKDLAPVMLALSQADPRTKALNLNAFVDDFLEAFGNDDKDRYYMSSAPAAALPMQGGGAPAAPGGPGGATAPQAVDANSPSNAFSQSPVAAIQRMGAASGGPVNIG